MATRFASLALMAAVHAASAQYGGGKQQGKVLMDNVKVNLHPYNPYTPTYTPAPVDSLFGCLPLFGCPPLWLLPPSSFALGRAPAPWV